MNLRLSAFIFLISLAATAKSAAPGPKACQPLEMTYQQLQSAYQARLATVTDEKRPDFLNGVIPCLFSTDPFLRDQIGYEGTASLLRRDGELSPTMISALTKLKKELTSLLSPEVADPDGVMKPFAIILLAEVARTDRIHGWMSEADRLALITTAHDYLMHLDDYRAFEDGVGFRHGVAHGADLILQLALNSNIEPAALAPLVTAIEAKMSPKAGIAYTTGEPGRLARAIFYLLQRAGHSETLQTRSLALLETLKNPAPYERWSEVFASESGLAFRHNRRSLAEALYVQLAPHAEHEVVAPYWQQVREAVKTIP